MVITIPKKPNRNAYKYDGDNCHRRVILLFLHDVKF